MSKQGNLIETAQLAVLLVFIGFLTLLLNVFFLAIFVPVVVYFVIRLYTKTRQLEKRLVLLEKPEPQPKPEP